MVLSGEFPGMPEIEVYEESTRYAVHYIMDSSVEKLYTFTVADAVLEQLAQIVDDYRKRYMDRAFKSLEILESL